MWNRVRLIDPLGIAAISQWRKSQSVEASVQIGSTICLPQAYPTRGLHI